MSDSARLRALLAEVSADRQALDAHVKYLKQALATKEMDHGTNALVAVSLHHWYSALESIWERIARAFEGLPERDERWHQDLLHVMTLPIEAVRPAVIRAELGSDLREILGFRHFFRHAYVVSFDRERLERAALALTRAHPAVSEDLDRFAETIRRALD